MPLGTIYRMARATDAEADGGLSPTVSAVYERILREILSGTRKAGSIVRDLDIATELGVSRTPVREALQMLRGIGVVEVLPSRFTRIAVLGVQDLEQAGRVSLDLYRLVIEEVAASEEPVPLDEILATQEACAAAIGDPKRFFEHSFRLHDLIVGLSRNAHLQRAIEGVAKALHLALLSNLEVVDLQHVLAGQQAIIEGLRGRERTTGRGGVEPLRGIRDRLPLPSAG